MAGRFSFSVPERRNAADPWFRIGTLDVSTTVLVVLLSVASMFVWAIDDALWANLVLIPEAVRNGEVWRLFTWPLANQPGLWEVLTLAIFWYFGREIEGLVGRVRFGILLLLLTVVPAVFGVILDIGDYGLAAVELGVFLIFVAEYPYARFFFGIPAWAIGAVIVGIEVLQYMGDDESERIFLLFVSLATAGPDGTEHGAGAEPAVDPQDPVAGIRLGRFPAPTDAPAERRWRGRRRAVVGVHPHGPDAADGAAAAADGRRQRPGRARRPPRQDLRAGHGRPHHRREAPPQRALQAHAQPPLTGVSINSSVRATQSVALAQQLRIYDSTSRR